MGGGMPMLTKARFYDSLCESSHQLWPEKGGWDEDSRTVPVGSSRGATGGRRGADRGRALGSTRGQRECGDTFAGQLPSCSRSVAGKCRGPRRCAGGGNLRHFSAEWRHLPEVEPLSEGGLFPAGSGSLSESGYHALGAESAAGSRTLAAYSLYAATKTLVVKCSNDGGFI